ncbi:hypothetical protein [uncultured Bifidobacterium sp.]|uniref:hypothetical protein n=1 Tax=uncultured Bifidobacterium sp. TaxID=165187 RepID=UPI0026397AB1|nr:hypothetical protein [uncultured Bifidobacterium sp.]
MKKYIAKDKLAYEDGYLMTEDGTVVSIVGRPIDIELRELAHMADVLAFIDEHEDEIAKAKVEGEMPAFAPVPDSRIELKKKNGTPKLDEYVDNVKAIVEEIEDNSKVEEANKIANEMIELIDMAESDKVLVDMDAGHLCKLPCNPLELNKEGIVSIVFAWVESKETIKAVGA